MERRIVTDHHPSLVFKDWDSAVEAVRKINIQYFDILLIEFNGEIIGYGIYNPFREEFLEKDSVLVKKSLGQL